MATAVDNPPLPKTTAPAVGLLPASIFGAVLLFLVIFLVGYVVPWALSSIVPTVGGFVDIAFRVVAQVAAVVGLIWLGSALGNRLMGGQPPKGLRGGIFLTVCCTFLTFFVARAIGLALEGSGFVGQLITVAVLAGLLFGSFKLLTGGRGRRWMLALESQGWFSTFSYKRSQGQRVRKWTLIGILLVGGSGIYALVNQGMLPTGDWSPRIPFTNFRLPMLTDVHYTAPILLVALLLWIGWRTVNVPTFADFLIATEAEMNKVSWTPLRKLIKDTVVVLVFTALLTGFLLTVDLFWGWTLSRSWIGVLPAKQDQKPADPDGRKAEW